MLNPTLSTEFENIHPLFREPCLQSGSYGSGADVSTIPSFLTVPTPLNNHSVQISALSALTDVPCASRRQSIMEGDLNEVDDIKGIKSIALIAHNNMKSAMKNFVQKHQNVLVHFELIGTENTLNMVKETMKEHHQRGELNLGTPCNSGPFGGDAQLSAAIVSGNVGCVIFLVDPLSAHPHQSDVESLLRLARVHEILLATNVMSAYCVIETLKRAVQNSSALPDSMRTSTLSDSVAMYKRRASVCRGAEISRVNR